MNYMGISMSKTYTLEVTTRHIVDAETEAEAIINAGDANISEMVNIEVVKIEDDE